MKSILRTAAAGVAIASFGFAPVASAATTAQADARAEILTALSVAVVPADNVLNFGTLADGGIAASTPVVLGANGTIAACPANLQCGGTTNAPSFTIEGLPTLLVNVTFENATETLTHSGGLDTLTAGTFTTDLVGNQVALDAGGDATFAVGGTLTVDPGQVPGIYTGSVTVEVAYN